MSDKWFTKSQSFTYGNFFTAEFVTGGYIMSYVRSRASSFILNFSFFSFKDFYPNFDRPIQNSRLYHGVQSLIIYHLRATSNSSRFIWIKKLNYLFKLIVNPSLHLLCFLTSSLGRRWFSPG